MELRIMSLKHALQKEIFGTQRPKVGDLKQMSVSEQTVHLPLP